MQKVLPALVVFAFAGHITALCQSPSTRSDARVLPASGSTLRIDEPRCEYLRNPLAIDTPQPRLSWSLQAEQRGQKQMAYRVLVASTPDCWPTMSAISGTAAKWHRISLRKSRMPESPWLRACGAFGRCKHGTRMASHRPGVSSAPQVECALGHRRSSLGDQQDLCQILQAPANRRNRDKGFGKPSQVRRARRSNQLS